MHTFLRLALAALFLAVAGCSSAEPLAHSNSGNHEVGVYLIAHIPEHGCEIYRINDNGMRFTYATICPAATTAPVETTEVHTESCGKNCRRRVEVMNPVVVSPHLSK